VTDFVARNEPAQFDPELFREYLRSGEVPGGIDLRDCDDRSVRA